jgi:excisionase family DNA binding protein
MCDLFHKLTYHGIDIPMPFYQDTSSRVGRRAVQATIKSRDELPLVLTILDLQKVLGISRVMAYELVHRQGFPAVRIGRCIRVPRESLLKWLYSQGG